MGRRATPAAALMAGRAEGSHPGWLLCAEFVLRIGHECAVRRNREVIAHKFRRWIARRWRPRPGRGRAPSWWSGEERQRGGIPMGTTSPLSTPPRTPPRTPPGSRRPPSRLPPEGRRTPLPSAAPRAPAPVREGAGRAPPRAPMGGQRPQTAKAPPTYRSIYESERQLELRRLPRRRLPAGPAVWPLASDPAVAALCRVKPCPAVPAGTAKTQMTRKPKGARDEAQKEQAKDLPPAAALWRLDHCLVHDLLPLAVAVPLVSGVISCAKVGSAWRRGRAPVPIGVALARVVDSDVVSRVLSTAMDKEKTGFVSESEDGLRRATNVLLPSTPPLCGGRVVAVGVDAAL